MGIHWPPSSSPTVVTTKAAPLVATEKLVSITPATATEWPELVSEATSTRGAAVTGHHQWSSDWASGYSRASRSLGRFLAPEKSGGERHRLIFGEETAEFFSHTRFYFLRWKARIFFFFWATLFSKKLYLKNFNIKKTRTIKSLREEEIPSGTKWGVG